MTSLDEIARLSDATPFPLYVLNGVESAACFFCAAFLGSRDSFHLYRAGIREVYLCDIDREKLAQMEAIYPREWHFEGGDAYRLAERLVRAEKQFDLVIVDPWAPHAKRLLTKTFPMWYALARRYLVCMAPLPWFQEQGLEPTVATARAALRRIHGLDVDVEALHWYSNWVGGVYWMVVRKHDPRHGVGLDWDHSDDETLSRRVRRKLRSLMNGALRRLRGG